MEGSQISYLPNYSSLRRVAHEESPRIDRFRRAFSQVRLSPEHPSSKPWANRSALIKALKLIISDKHRWGYIFEDDITWSDSNFTISLDELMRAEKPDLLFQYLGICRTDNTGTEGQNGCGRCTHAISDHKKGRKEVIDFSTQYKPILSTGRCSSRGAIFGRHHRRMVCTTRRISPFLGHTTTNLSLVTSGFSCKTEHGLPARSMNPDS